MVDYGHNFNVLKTAQKERVTPLESFATTPYVVLGILNRFEYVEKMAKIEQKVKANPLPFSSILVSFSTLQNGSKISGKPFGIIFSKY